MTDSRGQFSQQDLTSKVCVCVGEKPRPKTDGGTYSCVVESQVHPWSECPETGGCHANARRAPCGSDITMRQCSVVKMSSLN